MPFKSSLMTFGPDRKLYPSLDVKNIFLFNGTDMLESFVSMTGTLHSELYWDENSLECQRVLASPYPQHISGNDDRDVYIHANGQQNAATIEISVQGLAFAPSVSRITFAIAAKKGDGSVASFFGTASAPDFFCHKDGANYELSFTYDGDPWTLSDFFKDISISYNGGSTIGTVQTTIPMAVSYKIDPTYYPGVIFSKYANTASPGTAVAGDGMPPDYNPSVHGAAIWPQGKGENSEGWVGTTVTSAANELTFQFTCDNYVDLYINETLVAQHSDLTTWRYVTVPVVPDRPIAISAKVRDGGSKYGFALRATEPGGGVVVLTNTNWWSGND